MRKKILYIITKSNWGGAQRYVYDLTTHLPREHFDILVAFGQPGLLAEKLHAAGIRTRVIPSLERDISFASDVKSFIELLRLFKEEQPDVVHLNSSKAGGIGALAARLAKTPRIIFTAHGWPFWEARHAFARALIYFFSWLTALLSHTVIVISKYDEAVARQMPFVRHKIVQIYNGIDLDFPLGPGDVVRQSFPRGVRITGTIGELTKNKNHSALIEQARNDPNMHVAIVGDGEDRQLLLKKIEKYGLQRRVKIMGFHWASEVLRGFDMFALPSLKEGLPYVLLEAKAAGLPIVANRVGGVGEILDAETLHDFSLQKMVENTTRLYVA
jgi:glycosyltransferase involved in cell wall biosynthesis